MKIALLALASILGFSSTSYGSESSTDKVAAAGQCLSYLSMFNEADLKKKPTKTQELSELFKTSFAEAVRTPTIKKTIDSGFFAKSGANFNADFYSGFILSGIFNETTKKVKASIPNQEAMSLSFAELKKRWGEEAMKAYAVENCDLIR